MMKLSFMPLDILHPNVFYLKIWDRECIDFPVSIGDTTDQQNDMINFGKVRCKIGDFEGEIVNFPPNFQVPRRILSYHSLCCYLYHKYFTQKIAMEEGGHWIFLLSLKE